MKKAQKKTEVPYILQLRMPVYIWLLNPRSGKRDSHKYNHVIQRVTYSPSIGLIKVEK